MPKMSMPSSIAASAFLLKPSRRVKENRPEAPLNCFFQFSWPGQSGRAGCKTLSTSGRAFSQWAMAMPLTS